MPEIERLVDQMCLAATEDWLAEAEVYSLCLGTLPGHPEPATVRRLAIEVAAAAIVQGFVVPGEVTAEGFVPWAMGTQEAAARVEDLWLGSPSPVVGHGDVAWFDSTSLGDERAKAAR